MNLIYTESRERVRIGDIVDLGKGEMVEVKYFREPHKPSSQGKVSVETVNSAYQREYYVSVIGAEWVDREDEVYSL